MSLLLRSIVQCPHCGFKVTERMPQGKKVRHFQCPACAQVLTADEQQCCIFCRYGSVKCPAAQQADTAP